MVANPNVHNHTIQLRGESGSEKARAEVVDANGELVGESDWVKVATDTTKPVRATVVGPAGRYRVRQRSAAAPDAGSDDTTTELGHLTQPSVHILGRPDEIYGPFSEQESKQLRQFVADVRRLAQMKFQAQIPTTAKIRWTAESGMSMDMSHPDDDDTAAAVARFRQIYNPNEPTSFKAAFDLLKQNVHGRDGEFTADALDALKDHETAARVVLKQGIGFGIVLDDGSKQQVIDARRIIDAYFHGEYLHAGNDKADLVAVLDGIGPIARLTLYSTMGRLTDVYFKAANVVEQALDAQTSSQLAPGASPH